MTQPQNRYINKTRTAIRILVGFAAASVLKAIFCEQGIFGAQPAETGFQSFLALTLELSGPRQRLRLNDLLAKFYSIKITYLAAAHRTVVAHQ